jgi:hypothetical protein
MILLAPVDLPLLRIDFALDSIDVSLVQVHDALQIVHFILHPVDFFLRLHGSLQLGEHSGVGYHVLVASLPKPGEIRAESRPQSLLVHPIAGIPRPAYGVPRKDHVATESRRSLLTWICWRSRHLRGRRLRRTSRLFGHSDQDLNKSNNF